jgi:predicted lysophospholipase L1 biosynthesis ABC-type transport system permease subunit
MREEPNRDARFAIAIIDTVPLAQRPALMDWADKLLTIKASSSSPWQKAKAAMEATRTAQLIWPVLKVIATKLKRVGWDARSWPARMFMTVAAVSALVFGGKAAGVAALGTAIGVPLWVVFGAGAGFATAVVREIKRKGRPAEGASYMVIDADRREP